MPGLRTCLVGRSRSSRPPTCCGCLTRPQATNWDRSTRWPRRRGSGLANSSACRGATCATGRSRCDGRSPSRPADPGSSLSRNRRDHAARSPSPFALARPLPRRRPDKLPTGQRLVPHGRTGMGSCSRMRWVVPGGPTAFPQRSVARAPPLAGREFDFTTYDTLLRPCSSRKALRWPSSPTCWAIPESRSPRATTRASCRSSAETRPTRWIGRSPRGSETQLCALLVRGALDVVPEGGRRDQPPSPDLQRLQPPSRNLPIEAGLAAADEVCRLLDGQKGRRSVSGHRAGQDFSTDRRRKFGERSLKSIPTGFDPSLCSGAHPLRRMVTGGATRTAAAMPTTDDGVPARGTGPPWREGQPGRVVGDRTANAVGSGAASRSCRGHDGPAMSARRAAKELLDHAQQPIPVERRDGGRRSGHRSHVRSARYRLNSRSLTTWRLRCPLASRSMWSRVASWRRACLVAAGATPRHRASSSILPDGRATVAEATTATTRRSTGDNADQRAAKIPLAHRREGGSRVARCWASDWPLVDPLRLSS